MQNERDSFDIRAIEHKGLGVISKDSNIYLNLLNLLIGKYSYWVIQK